MFESLSPVVQSGMIYTGANVNLVYGSDHEFIVFRAPKTCKIVGLRTWSNAAVSAGTLQVSFINKGTALAGSTTISTHGTAVAYAADTPAEETVSAGALTEGEYVSLVLSNRSSGTTVALNGFGWQFDIVYGKPAGLG